MLNVTLYALHHFTKLTLTTLFTHITLCFVCSPPESDLDSLSNGTDITRKSNGHNKDKVIIWSIAGRG